jgi:hypothetical protein
MVSRAGAYPRSMTPASSSTPASITSSPEPPALRPRAARILRLAIASLPYLVTAAKLIWAWAWLWSWQLKLTVLLLLLARPLVGRTLSGWRERVASC